MKALKVTFARLKTWLNGFYIAIGGNTFGSKKLIGSTDNQDFGIITNNTERVTVTKDGNVGINTTALNNKLTISNGDYNVFTKIDANSIKFTRSSDGADRGIIDFDGIGTLTLNSNAASGIIRFLTDGRIAMTLINNQTAVS